jgi:hypothetical protein
MIVSIQKRILAPREISNILTPKSAPLEILYKTIAAIKLITKGIKLLLFFFFFPAAS